MKAFNFKVTVVVLLSFFIATPAFSQSTYATVGGTIEDATGALIPGVTVTATNIATGVVTTVLTNEAGAYSFPSLLPGTYRVSAELSGFQTQTYTDVQLGNADRVRLNFTLKVGGVNTAVEVSVAADTLLATSSSSVGEVLSQQRVQDLPTVSNNVLDLFRLIPGIRINDNGVQGTFAGLTGFGTVNIQRDGVDANGGTRWGTTAITATTMSPDLVGEVRMITSPVDVELGRGNAQIQFMTRSGTNRFNGALAWFARNTALDANTWNNNNDIDPKTGRWKPTRPDWANTHQFTGSYGGPLVKNKTFFFALWDSSLVNGRSTPNPIVLTPCARNGIFRYYDNWNNGNAVQVAQTTGTTPTIAVVDLLGNPTTPANNPNVAPFNGSAFSGALRYTSVFGPLSNTPTKPDCSDAVVSGAPWDTYRRALDPTGFVTKVLGQMPLPNNYEIGDGLNTAGYRWVRNERNGTEGIFGFNNAGLSSPTNLARKQINTKVDHNFNASNKLAVSYTYERSSGNANYETWPGGFRGRVFRHPQTLSINFTSTLSPILVNEVRVGMRRIGGNTYNGLNDPENGKDAQAFFPNFSGYPVEIGLGVRPAVGTGPVDFQSNQPLGGGSTSSYLDTTALWTYADTLSWTRGKHAFKFGGEIRRGHSNGYDAGIFPTTIPRAVGGDLATSAISATAIGSTNMPGLAGTTTTGNNVRMRNLLSFLAGSLASVNQLYFMESVNKLDAFEDYKTFPWSIRDTVQNEASFFVKDDWKARKSLTLNLGLRWDYYGSPYDTRGLTPAVVGGPFSIFGISGRSFDGWMKPGVRAEPTRVEFVGKNSPNPDKTWYPNDWNNFGPAVGFAWQLPWFGAGKTTVRGGYQVTYNAGQVYNAITQENRVPGSSLNAAYTGDSGANAYLDLTKLPSLIPVPQIIKPLQPVPLSDRSQQIYNPQPGLVNPYVQNLTLSVTRSIRSNLTVDVRYVSTLGRKGWNAFFNLNSPNFLYNGLKEAFDAARAGNDSSPSLQVLENMFKGINLAGAGYGSVGTTVNGVLQTAGMHLRASSNFQSNLANGNYSALAATLNTLNYTKTAAFPGNSALPDIPAGVRGGVIGLNGFPENFVVTNPQFTNVYMIANSTTNNYHSLEAQVTMRPTHGISMQSTYIFSKNLGVAGGNGSYTNPVDRHADYSVQPDTRKHDFRTNGSFALPIGPNKLLFANSSGTLARIIENWQTGWVVNLTSGAPLDLTAQSMLYNNGTPDIVGSFDTKSGKVQWPEGASSGNYFTPGAFSSVKDPQCGNVTALQNLANSCTLNAIMDTKTGQVLLQNPLPGTRGTLGQSAIAGAGIWRFDANLSKSFKVAESKTLQFRMDATDVLNHPEPATPTLSINNATFGLITGNTAKSNLHRQFLASLRLNF